MARGSLFIVSAPSGAGKTSLVKALCNQMEGLSVSVSHTTRPKRPGEIHGKDYFFVSLQEFEAKIANAEFLEYAQVFDNYYGTSTASVEAQLQSGKDIILEIDWQGARQVREKIADSISVFILPPSRDVLEQRLSDRGQDSADIISRRMQDAETEMSHYAEFEYLIINEGFDQAIAEFATIVKSQRLKTQSQLENQSTLIKSLLPG